MPSRLRQLVLMPSWHCDIACQHCLFSSSPRLRGRLPLELAQAAIREAAAATACERVVVSGGEPFADADYLLELAQAARAARLEFHVVTNGSFAREPARARAQLQALQGAGLRSLTISWDVFHAEFLPAEVIRTLLRLCRSLDLNVLLSAVVTRTRTLAAALELLGDDAYGVPVVQSQCLPVGRAARKVPVADLLPVAERDRGHACRSDFDSVAIVHDGSVYPCTAVGGFTPGLRLGSLHEASLAALLGRRDREWTWLALASRGPQALLELSSAEERAQARLEPGLHDCVACHRLFSGPLGGQLVERLRDRCREQAGAWLESRGIEITS